MSMSSWTTNAYGVINEDITVIPISSVWPIFMAIQTAADEDKLAASLHDFCESESITDDEMSDEDKETFIRNYYEQTTNYYIPDAKAAVLADLVARNLHISFGNIIMEKNDEDDIIVGIGAYYPWDTPEALKNASQEDYENAFINAYAMFGIDGKSCCIEEQSIENWG